MVQLGEGARDTRRRIKLSQVVAQSEDVEQVQQVLQLFSAQTARLVTLAGDEEGARTAEVTHEALLEHWHSLNAWLDSSRDDLRFQRRLEEAACHWEKQKRPRGLLWRSPDLETLRDFYRRKGEEMTARQVEFYRACERAKKQLKWAAALITLLVLGLIGYAFYLTNLQLLKANYNLAKVFEEKAGKALEKYLRAACCKICVPALTSACGALPGRLVQFIAWRTTPPGR
jgi:hypothetical protein